MSGNPDGLRTLANSSKLSIDKIRYVPDATPDTIRSINRGILFLIAFWSGPSFRAFSEMTSVVAQLKAEDDLEIVVVDVDGSSELDTVPELTGQVQNGAGETLWVRKGKIVATSGPGLRLECFKPNTISLLAEP